MLDELDRDFDKGHPLIERLVSQTTLNVEAMPNSDDESENEHLDDPDLYFGEKAVDNFWDFYKSDRKFKDFATDKEEIRDYRQAYFQTCNEMGVFPRAKLIIRDESSSTLEYVNVSLLNKSSFAVA